MGRCSPPNTHWGTLWAEFRFTWCSLQLPSALTWTTVTVPRSHVAGLWIDLGTSLFTMATKMGVVFVWAWLPKMTFDDRP